MCVMQRISTWYKHMEVSFPIAYAFQNESSPPLNWAGRGGQRSTNFDAMASVICEDAFNSLSYQVALGSNTSQLPLHPGRTSGSSSRTRASQGCSGKEYLAIPHWSEIADDTLSQIKITDT